MREQVFDHEWDALQELKQKYAKICRFYSDEFLMACLFARKMDVQRVNVLLIANWKVCFYSYIIFVLYLSIIN